LDSSSNSDSTPATVATLGSRFFSRPKDGEPHEVRSNKFEYDLETILLILIFLTHSPTKTTKTKNEISDI
jgi:hypothetical protein